MKPIAFCSSVLFATFLAFSLTAQTIGDVWKKKADSTAIKISGILGAKNGKLTTAEVTAGLKEALEIGAGKSIELVSKPDGFFGNELIKILLPPEVEQVEKTLRSIGFGRQVDQAILSMNRAAEDAAKKATPIFVNAIKGITVDDAFGILRGSQDAATKYLQSKTIDSLAVAFRPEIDASLSRVNATKHWDNIFSRYNQFTGSNVETDLTTYVTNKALEGIFKELAKQEAAIRKDPVNRTSDLLKKVFANN